MVTNLKRKTTKKGDAMATLTLEDVDGEIEVVMFPRTYREWGELLAPDTLL
jgi:DNA polymerase-3 subunit alpha